MLSRRNVRVKVMQQLYSLAQDKELSLAGAKRAYLQSVQDTFLLYLLNLYCITRVCSFAEEDGQTRLKKHLKSEDDVKFTPKLYNNPLISSLVNNKVLQARFKKERFEEGLDEDLFRKIYKEFAKEEPYIKYLLADSTNEDTIEILLELYRTCRRNELFNEIMDDRFCGWSDDKSLVIGALKKTLKALPAEGSFYEEHQPDEETIKDFGLFLLTKTYEEDAVLEEMIKPVLENWDSERVALIDMILIKMGIIEMLNIKTIPAKVTLNEYVELSKQYSTDKSKEFVNGLLDKILKELMERGQIVKEGRGLME
ncbi:MAG: transcription antitermination factor NusB [Saprospiraceae bacterium]|nr:transcription antitermination factor NusB [Candidatus Vicinibacter proximus]MBL7823783.1 transcription antitermination factor NusB [Saprospiraceae bacterium]MCC6841772.1 transcription antitermination factor NusB [Saprospiraceae bacterium]HRG32952.1 transcription antitermination factor NusB [Saprospiraceae bacterium]